MTKSKGRTQLSTDERVLKAVNALFILQAVQMGLTNLEMRKILRIDMKEITETAKAVNRALRKSRENDQK